MKHYFFFWNVRLCTLLLCFGPCCGQVFAENAGEVRPGKCAITSGGHTYRPSGCLIRKGTDEGLGWHIIEKKDGSPLLDEILTVSIVETGPGTAEVSGLTQGGINSRWGRPSATEPAGQEKTSVSVSNRMIDFAHNAEQEKTREDT